MDSKDKAARYAFLSAIVAFASLVIVIAAFWRPIMEGRVTSFKVGEVSIEFDARQIPAAGQEIVVPLSELGPDGKIFILGRDRGEFDAVCTDPESIDPNADDQRMIELRKEALAWKNLERLKLASVRPARKPYDWCKEGASQTYALTELGLEVKGYLASVMLEALKFRKA